MPGAKLIAQIAAPGDASIVRRWRSCRGCSAIGIRPLPQTGSSARAVEPGAQRARRPRPRRRRRRPRSRRSIRSRPGARLQPSAGEPPGKTSCARRGDERARQRRSRAAAPSARGSSTVRSSPRSSSWIASSVVPVLALAEVRPGERAAAAPEEERRPALAAVVVPDRVAGVDRDRMLDARAPRLPAAAVSCSPLKPKARRVDAENGEAERRVAAAPLEHVWKRPHAVQLGEVEEVDEHRPGRRRARSCAAARAVQPAIRPGNSGAAMSLRLGRTAREARCTA